jgi:hypothetical protein
MSPFAEVQQQQPTQPQSQPHSQQTGVKRTLSVTGGKKSTSKEVGRLGESLLDGSSNVTDNEAATAQKATIPRRRSSASSWLHSVRSADDAGSEPKAEKAELPLKCAPALRMHRFCKQTHSKCRAAGSPG